MVVCKLFLNKLAKNLGLIGDLSPNWKKGEFGACPQIGKKANLGPVPRLADDCDAVATCKVAPDFAPGEIRVESELSNRVGLVAAYLE